MDENIWHKKNCEFSGTDLVFVVPVPKLINKLSVMWCFFSHVK